MATRGRGQFPICSYVRNFKYFLLLNQWSELKMVWQNWLSKVILYKDSLKKFDRSRSMATRGMVNHDKANFKNLMKPMVRIQNNLVEMIIG